MRICPFPARFALIVLLFVAAGCATPSSTGPFAVPLSYKTEASPGDFPSFPPCAAVADVQVADARADKTLGKRFINDNAATSAPVTASSDVAAWARSGAQAVLKQAGVTLGKPGGPILRISVDEIRTNENIVHRSGYDGRISISARLSKAGSSSECWKDRAEGSAENYGYTGSVENYQETLNHALDRAMIRLLSTPQFRKAVCGCGNG
jgi:hypothetical protein